MKNTTHIAEFDGVRGIAVLLVVVFHSIGIGVRPPEGRFTTIAAYGFVGVDLFFVLSGFLITGILLNAKGKPAYFRNFYVKRALRIWPLYSLLVFASFGLEPMMIRLAHLPLAGDLTPFKDGHKIMYVFLIQNLWYLRVPTFLTVTWSLAIEEQFYFVWPWIVLWFSRKNLARVTGAALLLSPCIRLWAILHGVDDNSLYFVTCYRLDGLSLGALIALWCQSDLFSAGRAKWASLTALAVGVPGFIWSRQHSSWPIMYSMMAIGCAGTVILAIWCCKTNSSLGRPLRAKWLQHVGKISYCLYLVHLPIFWLVDTKLSHHHNGTGWAVFTFSLAFGLVMSISLASLSWYLFESQILKLKSVLEYGRGITDGRIPPSAHTPVPAH